MQLLRDVNSRGAQNRFSEPKERTHFEARDNMYDESTGERHGKRHRSFRVP